MTTRHLLRFAVNRQPSTRIEFPHVLIGPFWADPATEFQIEVARADGWTDRAGVAARYLRGDLYIGDRLRSWPAVAGALAALPGLVAMASAGDESGVRAGLDELVGGGLRSGPEPESAAPPETLGAAAAGAGVGPAAAIFWTLVWDSWYAAALAPDAPAQEVADLADTLRLGGALGRVALAQPFPSIAAALIALPALPPWVQPSPVPGSPAARGITPAGVTDLLLIEDELVGYHMAEISFVENVLRTERKERTFRKLDRVYDSYTLSTENAEQTERDLQSTTRSELQSEVDKTAGRDSSLTAGVSVSASYGPFVSVDSDVQASTGTSSETATSTSNSYAQDLVDRSVTTISRKVVETVVHRTLSETEDTSLHGFENTTEADVVGFYRWLQQTWQAQVMNYGRRLLLEVIVPEPAVLWRAARSSGVAAKITREPPAPLTIEPHDLSASNYDGWAASYGATGLTPPPAETLDLNKVFELPELEHQKSLSGNDFVVQTKSGYIEIPDGYVAVQAWGDYSTKKWGTGEEQLRVHVGNGVLDLLGGPSNRTLQNMRGPVEVAVFLYDDKAATVDIRLQCRRTDEAFEQWQLTTFEAIADAYRTQLDAYLAETAATTVAEQTARADIPSEAKRRIEGDELKRAALTIILDSDFSARDAVSGPTDADPIPVINVAKALKEGQRTSAMEAMVEWINQVYVLYPYFWGRQETWYAALQESDPDPTFEAFLRAGSARLQIPVRPGFEPAMLWYLYTGELWAGGPVPVIGDPYYLPIIEELVEATGMSLDEPDPYGTPWTYDLPTTLVAIAEDVSDLGL